MIKANELRIGNLLEFNLYGHKEIRKVDHTDFEFISDNVLRCAEPIPLTEKWLLKFGFEKIKNLIYTYSYPKKEFGYTINGNNDDGWYFIYFDNVKILYVHQLQNLYFSLMGKELTLKKRIK